MKKFRFYLDDNSVKVNVGDKLPLTMAGMAPNVLIYGIKDEQNADLLSVGPTLCSNDPHDQNYLVAEKMESLPEDVTATILEVNDDFGVCEIVISIDELENT